MSTTNIDDILTSQTSANIPPQNIEPSPEQYDAPDEVQSTETEQDTYGLNEAAAETSKEVDDYGNERPPARTYTEDEVNERINAAMRDRVARFERNNPTPQQEQRAKDIGFEQNPDSPEDYTTQLESFIYQTIEKRSRIEAQQQQFSREQSLQVEFEQKFSQGISKFPDFKEVASSAPMTDAMTIATRAMKDPAAFIYAAAKRAPKELERISHMPDQYAQMVEIGKLEERMRAKEPVSKAPRPIGRNQEDSHIILKDDKAPSIEDLIQKAESKKRAAMNLNRRR